MVMDQLIPRYFIVSESTEQHNWRLMPSIDKQAVEAGEEADMAAEYEETGDDGVIENETPERLL